MKVKEIVGLTCDNPKCGRESSYPDIGGRWFELRKGEQAWDFCTLGCLVNAGPTVIGLGKPWFATGAIGADARGAGV